MQAKGKHITVIGLGKSGISASAFLAGKGATVTATDASGPDRLGDAAAYLTSLGVALELGGHRRESFEQTDLVVVSPGVPLTIEPLKMARAKGIPIVGEMELAASWIKVPVVAITGTNGKTTTTMMVESMLKASGIRTWTGGNIGTPMIDFVAGGQHADIVVSEVSSFQLDTIRTFRPHVAVLLNITEDHLDRYESFDAYVASKKRIFENQTPDDFAIVNGDDPAAIGGIQSLKAKTLFFRRGGKGMETGRPGAILQGGTAMLKTADREMTLDFSRVSFGGVHNMENACAAALASLSAGADPAAVQEAVDGFSLPPHRLEPVGKIAGIAYYNDSKATNVDAVIRALESFACPVVLLMGGRDKDGDFSRLRRLAKARVRELVLMGEAGPDIAAALEDTVAVSFASTMEEAVVLAGKKAVAGDIVLLSPGCASFDMFDNYAHRGDCFRKAVERLQ